MSEAKTIPAKYIFLNIDGFTYNRSVEAQAEILQALNSIVESSIKEHGITKEDVIFLPSGDGICIALLNIESPYDIHLSIALSIIREVYKYNLRTPDKMRRFEVHIGIDAHTDNLVTDINGNLNIAGAGVNMASRLMRLAGGNQILVSETVYKTLHYHEKYISTFRSFKTKSKNDFDLFVHQFIDGGGEGNKGLSTAIPTALATAVRVDPEPIMPKNAGKKTGVGQTEFNTKPAVSAPADSVAPKISPPDTQSVQTQSYLTGILAQQNQEETKPAGKWIKPKPEPAAFLEQVVPQKRNYSLVWTALAVLVIGGAAAFGGWMLYTGGGGDAPGQNAENSAAAVVNEISKDKPTPLPVNSPAAAPTPAVVPGQTIAETTPKTNQPFTPTKPETAEPKAVIAPLPKTRKSFSRPPAPVPPPSPPAVHQTSVKPAATASKPKQQTAKADKPKSSKRVTLDDLINGNK